MPASAWAKISDGAAPPTPPPAPIPTNGLLVDWASENYVITDLGGGFAQGDLTDDSGNGNDISTTGTLLIHVPTIVPGAFNADVGLGFTRANTFGMNKVAPTWLSGNAPRTFAFVVEGTNIDLGEIFHRRSLVGNSYSIKISGTTTPQIFWENNAGTIDNNGTFYDLNGQKAVVLYWTDGGIGDTLFCSINGVPVPLTGTMAAEGAATNYIELAGFTFGPRLDGLLARFVAYNRVLSSHERAIVVNNFGARYL